MDMRIILTLILAVAMGLPTLIFALSAWSTTQSANEAKNWPTTTGTIKSADVMAMERRIRRSTSVASYRIATYYAPQVKYVYQIQGVNYEAERLQMGEPLWSSDTAEAEHHLTNYPIGTTVTVYYNPNDPSQATLSPKPTAGTRIQWIVAFALLALFIVIIYSMWTDKVFTPS